MQPRPTVKTAALPEHMGMHLERLGKPGHTPAAGRTQFSGRRRSPPVQAATHTDADTGVGTAAAHATARRSRQAGTGWFRRGRRQQPGAGSRRAPGPRSTRGRQPEEPEKRLPVKRGETLGQRKVARTMVDDSDCGDPLRERLGVSAVGYRKGGASGAGPLDRGSTGLKQIGLTTPRRAPSARSLGGETEHLPNTQAQVNLCTAVNLLGRICE
ncbi:hypothetical protein BDK51DRAFT_51505 [Blyttiomyces helicus]|uniref:Uncharacterized protein n=1 Tax=Blyttiomyces helicus TaxID=388810 RepID=A0A4P9WDY2_9FUNG|nr:hypothetical protein BDK51DRAFT_51505 [Blyttiomyces helicus]|eukprot:RKO89448.1 hypothetical protein BDK51DRAFT_51505 [Blyttiomyces helicus]